MIQNARADGQSYPFIASLLYLKFSICVSEKDAVAQVVEDEPKVLGVPVKEVGALLYQTLENR